MNTRRKGYTPPTKEELKAKRAQHARAMSLLLEGELRRDLQDELVCECGKPLAPHEEDGLCTACLTPKGLLCPCGEPKPLEAELCEECYFEENSTQAPRKAERMN